MILNSKGYEENLYAEGCIRTYSGIYFNILNPTPEMFCIEDVAHALANIARFGGHTNNFYSVARHSVNCCEGIEKEYKFDMLMHDCSEAYLYDFPRPIKKLIPQYKEIEERIMTAAAQAFGFTFPLKEKITEVDNLFLEWEWKEIFIKGVNYDVGRKKDENDFIRFYNKLKPKK